jgi:hypothetical protein
LETGKRLNVLKELTLHGEFQKRVEMLGFSGPTACRFMQVASKTAKSLNLSVLSTQVKNVSAFLELSLTMTTPWSLSRTWTTSTA